MSASPEDYINTPIAIILNGTSSVGKSSVAEALQQSLVEYDLLLLGIDTFVNMLPQHLVGESADTEKGFKFVKIEAGYDIEIGEFGNDLVHQMHEMARNLLLIGRNVIIDHVILSQAWAKHLEDLLDTNVLVLKVLLQCELSVLENRELQRQNRRPGLARQLQRVENNLSDYSVVIDTTKLHPSQVALQISQTLRDQQNKN